MKLIHYVEAQKYVKLAKKGSVNDMLRIFLLSGIFFVDIFIFVG